MFLQQSWAFIEKTFKKGFILREENLYKIKDIIEKRIKENSKDVSKDNSQKGYKKDSKNYFNIIFSVKRDDWFMFITPDIKKILEEHNWKDKSINEIKIAANPTNFIYFDEDIDIIFNKKSWVTIRINWHSQDFVNLLYSDLEEYLSDSVLKLRNISLKKWTLPAILLSIIFYLYYILFKKILIKPDVEEIIASEDVIEKLNFIIRKNQEIHWLWWEFMSEFLMVAVIIIIILCITYWYDYFYPKNVFYMWERKNIYNKRIDLRKNILRTIVIWWIIMGVIVSRLTWVFTKIISN